MRVFVGYAETDSLFGTEISRVLRQAGHEVDYAPAGGRIAGTNWQSRIESAAAMIVVLSPANINEASFREKWQYALELDTQVVVVTREVDDVPEELSGVECVDGSILNGQRVGEAILSIL